MTMFRRETLDHAAGCRCGSHGTGAPGADAFDSAKAEREAADDLRSRSAAAWQTLRADDEPAQASPVADPADEIDYLHLDALGQERAATQRLRDRIARAWTTLAGVTNA